MRNLSFQIGTHTRAFCTVVTLIACLSGFGLAQAELDVTAVVDVGIFSAGTPGGGLPAEWQPLTFKKIERYSTYRLIQDEETVVVEASSEGGASGMTRKIRIDPKEFPIIHWRWKVGNVLQRGDVTSKEGDDYPARIYITFEYDSSRVGLLERAKYEAIRLFYGEYPPLGAISYIWASQASVGTVVPNPYTDQVMMFVVESGAEQLNTWVDEQRNVYEDYKQAFGVDPPMISGVAIMTDTDNTQESARAYYGDITFTRASISLF